MLIYLMNLKKKNYLVKSFVKICVESKIEINIYY